jgi:hypothetical protein
MTTVLGTVNVGVEHSTVDRAIGTLRANAA